MIAEKEQDKHNEYQCVHNIEKALPQQTVKQLHKEVWYESSVVLEIVSILTDKNIAKGLYPLLGAEDKVIIPIIGKQRRKCHKHIEYNPDTT